MGGRGPSTKSHVDVGRNCVEGRTGCRTEQEGMVQDRVGHRWDIRSWSEGLEVGTKIVLIQGVVKVIGERQQTGHGNERSDVDIREHFPCSVFELGFHNKPRFSGVRKVPISRSVTLYFVPP
eukprot:sb/3475941/